MDVHDKMFYPCNSNPTYNLTWKSMKRIFPVYVSSYKIVQKFPINEWKIPNQSCLFICKPKDEWSNKWFYVWTTSLRPLNSKYLNFCKTKGGIFRVGSILPRAVTHLRCPDYWGTVAHELGVLGQKIRVALCYVCQVPKIDRPKQM